MKCPIDGETLVISDRNNIEIDYCPSCRGVWLDRGELDKIIERSEQQTGSSFQPSSDYSRPERQEYQDDYPPMHRDSSRGRHPKKRRESFLGDLFDFGD